MAGSCRWVAFALCVAAMLAGGCGQRRPGTVTSGAMTVRHDGLIGVWELVPGGSDPEADEDPARDAAPLVFRVVVTEVESIPRNDHDKVWLERAGYLMTLDTAHLRGQMLTADPLNDFGLMGVLDEWALRFECIDLAGHNIASAALDARTMKSMKFLYAPFIDTRWQMWEIRLKGGTMSIGTIAGTIMHDSTDPLDHSTRQWLSDLARSSLEELRRSLEQALLAGQPVFGHWDTFRRVG